MKFSRFRFRNTWMYVFLLTAFIALLVFQRHQHTGYFNWRSKMWGDPAGYYVYAPALIIYGFDGSKLPQDIVAKTGEGFTLNAQGKIITRYSCGVAMLQMPVFLTVHAMAGITGQEKDGFSGIYHYVSDVAAVIYTVLGLLLLWLFLRNYFNKRVTFWVMGSLFAGTNLLYYAIDATGMSHIYSFFLFSSLLVLSQRIFYDATGKARPLHIFLAGMVSALIILIRPTNIVFVMMVFLLNINSFRELLSRFLRILTPLNILLLVLSFLIVLLPQVLYWQYAYGSFLTDTYQGYGFTHWTSPRVAEFLFSTNNGLFLYNPLYFIIVVSLVWMAIRKVWNGILILTVFTGLIYVFSSWFVFSFGCGFGSRNFVEYTTIFALPLGYLFSGQPGISSGLKKLIFFFTLIFVLVNLKLVFAYDKCFLGKDWDYGEYTHFLKSRRYNEKIDTDAPEPLNKVREFSTAIRINLKNSTLVNYRRALVSVNTRLYDPGTEAMIVLSVTSGDSTIYWNGFPLKNSYDFKEEGKSQKVTGDFWLPRNYTTNSVISTYIWNRDRDSLEVSGLKIHLR